MNAGVRRTGFYPSAIYVLVRHRECDPGLEPMCSHIETGLGLEVTQKICMHLLWCTVEELDHRSLVFEKTIGNVSVHHRNDHNGKLAQSLNPWQLSQFSEWARWAPRSPLRTRRLATVS